MITPAASSGVAKSNSLPVGQHCAGERRKKRVKIVGFCVFAWR